MPAPQIEVLRQSLRAIATAEMAQDSAHDLAHLDRVWTTCERIATAEGGDLRILLAGAYLHDLVNLPKNAPNRSDASSLAAEAAAPHLTALGYSTAEVTAAQHVIRAHSFSAGIEPESHEAQILRDADRLDAIGAIGLARCFAVSGSLGRPLYAPDDPFATTRPLDDRTQTLDHFAVKLLRLGDGMLTQTGQRIAAERIAVLKRYLRDLAAELGQPAPEHWFT
ncbi:HD domain-containing protein [Phaeobacter sp. CNT1-3]|nr:HD domain-containing protein [Phaeobacter sp. CNT1-3]